MNTNNGHLDELTEIRKLMEKSSRFISLSGLSGVSAGLIALIAAAIVYIKFNFNTRYFSIDQYFVKGLYLDLYYSYNWLVLLGVLTLVLALGLGILFTVMKAKKKDLPIWDKTAKRMLINLFIPLLTGGLFCIILIYHELLYLVAPATLIFYGLALLNASKYTLHEIRFLGVSEIILGILSSIFIGYGLVFWAMGFGVLHIIYGLVMYNKYEK